MNKPLGPKSYFALQFCMLTDFMIRKSYTLFYFEPI